MNLFIYVSFFEICIPFNIQNLKMQIQKVDLQQKPEKQVSKKLHTGIPQQYLQNESLNEAIAILPPNYSFQIPKTLHRIATVHSELKKQQQQILRVSLQFPQGLMLFGCVISDILRTFSKVPIEIIIMGDVTYGACCVDDLASDQMNCDLLVHYGHSCLVPVTQTLRKVLYIFVQIQVDITHFVDSIQFNFPQKHQLYYLMGTIQFNSAIYQAKTQLISRGYTNIVVPQQKPRSGGQVLGCTSPKLQQKQNNNIWFLCDGRFHMQAAMIANPKFKFYQYDPYSRQLTQQKYATDLMKSRRMQQIERAKNGKFKRACIILGTLGRQGNLGILKRLGQKLQNRYQFMVLMASQINQQLLNLLQVDFFVQIACPRLSIDWSYGTPKPLLTPYELYALCDQLDISKNYSMDFYSYNGGPWSNFYGKAPVKKKITVGKQPKIKLQIEKQ